MSFGAKNCRLFFSVVFLVQALLTRKVYAVNGSASYYRRADNETLLCNGNADLCDLRYDQVTYPGTHNSAAYNLKFDCQATVRNCLDSKGVCIKQHAECLASYKVHCEASTNTCKQRNPKWLHWTCDGFDALCKKSDAAICATWQAVCTDSAKVCNVWGNACKVDTPEWLVQCLWENNPGHDIATQLKDGIRLLDIDTCLVDDDKVVACHGMGVTRALGDDLDFIFKQIRGFLKENPNEVITVEFNDIDGDPAKIGGFIQAKLEQYFVKEPGKTLMWSRKDNNETWPTLRKMIEADQRLAVFFRPLYPYTPNRQPWILESGYWWDDSYPYIDDDMTAAQLNQSFTGYCGDAKKVIESDMRNLGRVQWQTIDQTVAIRFPQVKEAIKNKTNPGYLCLGDQARTVNFDLLNYISDLCYSAFPYIFRVRVDYYWESNLFQVVKHLNELNVKRVRSGDTITPF